MSRAARQGWVQWVEGKSRWIADKRRTNGNRGESEVASCQVPEPLEPVFSEKGLIKRSSRERESYKNFKPPNTPELCPAQRPRLVAPSSINNIYPDRRTAGRHMYAGRPLCRVESKLEPTIGLLCAGLLHGRMQLLMIAGGIEGLDCRRVSVFFWWYGEFLMSDRV